MAHIPTYVAAKDGRQPITYLHPNLEPILKGTYGVIVYQDQVLQIVQAIGDGLTNKDIALTLGISEYTVKHHVTRIFDKVGVDSRLELAMFAIYHGLVETADADVRTQSA